MRFLADSGLGDVEESPMDVLGDADDQQEAGEEFPEVAEIPVAGAVSDGISPEQPEPSDIVSETEEKCLASDNDGGLCQVEMAENSHPPVIQMAGEQGGRVSGSEGRPIRVAPIGGASVTEKTAVPHAAGSPPRPAAGDHGISNPQAVLDFDSRAPSFSNEKGEGNDDGQNPGEGGGPGGTEWVGDAISEPKSVSETISVIAVPEKADLVTLPIAPPPKAKQEPVSLEASPHHQEESPVPEISLQEALTTPSPEPPGAPQIEIVQPPSGGAEPPGPSKDFIMKMLTLAAGFALFLLVVGHIKTDIAERHKEQQADIERIQMRMDNLESRMDNLQKKVND
ncbi:MAG TPA: hypothetical protein PL033_01715 [Candidatus Brocadiia bacterium]|nr:hypothetical protein [Candidatus Brocadiia bacterium]